MGRHADRWADRKVDVLMHGQTYRQVDKQLDGWTDRQIDGLYDRFGQMSEHTIYRSINRLTDNADTEASKNRRIYRQLDKQIYRWVKIDGQTNG